MSTSVGTFGSGKIAARYRASVEPALSRSRTVRLDNEDFNYSQLSFLHCLLFKVQ
jgi:hypothetical protein